MSLSQTHSSARSGLKNPDPRNVDYGSVYIKPTIEYSCIFNFLFLIERSDYMGKLAKCYDKFEEYLLVGSLVLNVIIVFAQVIMRSVFNYSLSWSEELSRYIFIWQTWLGASIALRDNEHIKVELLFNFFKSERAKNIIKIIASIIWFVFCVFLVLNGFELLQSMARRKALSSGMRIPLTFVYASLPISSLLICLRLIPRIFNDIKNIYGSLKPDGVKGGE